MRAGQGLLTSHCQCFRHIKAQIKEEYMDINSLDDTKLLMQYFKKHDTDNNHKLDGLELLKAITRMEGKYYQVLHFTYRLC